MALHTLVVVELLALWVGAALTTATFTPRGERLWLVFVTLLWPVSFLAAGAVRFYAWLRNRRR